MKEKQNGGTILPKDITDKIITDYFAKGLKQVKNGEAYTSFGLLEEDHEKITSKDYDKEVGEKFLLLVATQMAAKLGNKSNPKACKAKHYVAAIKKMDYQKYIQMDAPNEKWDKNDYEQAKEGNNDHAKKIKKSPVAPNKNKATLEKESRRLLAIAEMKKQHEEEKASVMAQLPKEYQRRFHQIAFSKWGKEPYRPVLVVDPYTLSYNSPARNVWLKMFDKTNDRRNHMTFLVYWLGTEDFSNAFTLVPRSKLTWHDDAEVKGYTQLPKILQKDNLTIKEREIVHGYEQYKERLLLKSSEEGSHFPWGEGPFEEYELLQEELIMDDVEELNDDVLHDSDDQDSVQTPIAKKSSTKKLKKKSNDKNDVSKQAKRKSKDRTDDIVGDDLVDSPIRKSDEGRKNKSAPKMSKSKALVADVTDFAEDEVDSADEADDGDASVIESDSEDDEDFGAQQRTKKTKRSKTPESQKNKSPKGTAEPNKKEAKPIKSNETTSSEAKRREKNTKIDRKRKKKEVGEKNGKEPKEPITKKNKLSQEEQERFQKAQKDYEKCQLKYYDLITRWNKVLEQGNADSVEAVLGEFSKEVVHMTSPFIESCGIPDLVKKSKPFFEGEEKKAYYTTVRIQVKNHYTESKANVPAGFEPKKRETLAISNDNETNVKLNETVVKTPLKDEAEAYPDSRMLEIQKSIELKVSTSNNDSGEQTPKIERSLLKSKSVDRDLEKKQSQPAKRMRMSLGSMLKSQSTQKDLSTAYVSPCTVVESKEKKIAWLTTVEETIGDLNDTRSLALEFFKEAATRFKSDNVNPDCVVRAIEKAIYKWSQKSNDLYWEKVHTIIAAICGKNERPGRLVQQIANGSFETPEQILEISEQDLFKSFNGEPF